MIVADVCALFTSASIIVVCRDIAINLLEDKTALYDKRCGVFA